MTITQGILLGIVEGITEFLPVSSTGHMVVMTQLLGLEQTDFLKTFEIVIQTGAVLAVLPMFIRRALRTPKKMVHIFSAFLPTAIAGVFLYPYVKNFLSNPSLVAWSLCIGGIIILAIEYSIKYRQNKNPDYVLRRSITIKQAIVLGTYQAIALIPGVSRSGATIAGGLLHGIDRRALVEFSFLLSIPTIMSAGAYDLLKTSADIMPTDYIILTAGFISAWLAASVVVRVFLRFVSTHTFISFGWYRIILGAILLMFFF